MQPNPEHSGPFAHLTTDELFDMAIASFASARERFARMADALEEDETGADYKAALDVQRRRSTLRVV